MCTERVMGQFPSCRPSRSLGQTVPPSRDSSFPSILGRMIMRRTSGRLEEFVTSVSSHRSNCDYTAGHGGSSSLTHCCDYWRGLSLAFEVVGERTRQDLIWSHHFPSDPFHSHS